MISQIKELYDKVRDTGEASLSFMIEGKKYVRRFCKAERLILIGAGHIAQPLCSYAADLGFYVTVIDDRPDFANHERFKEAAEIICDDYESAIDRAEITSSDYVAVITRGHRYDAVSMRKILAGEYFPKYLGMIGSKRRISAFFNMLKEEGCLQSDLDRIHSPIGLDINAQTPKEIAISIVAEMIKCRRSFFNVKTEETILALDDLDLPLIDRLASDDVPKSLILVYDSKGSTPAKTGAIMYVDCNFQTAGTIGGGCSEAEAVREAWRMIGTGEERCMTIDMTNDVNDEEDMVCGGMMKVFIKDISNKKII